MSFHAKLTMDDALAIAEALGARTMNNTDLDEYAKESQGGEGDPRAVSVPSIAVFRTPEQAHKLAGILYGCKGIESSDVRDIIICATPKTMIAFEPDNSDN